MKGKMQLLSQNSKKYRDAHFGIFGLTGVLSAIVLVLYGFLDFYPVELPYPRMILYVIPGVSFTAWFLIYLGYKDTDMGYRRITIYEIAEAIKCYKNKDYDGVFEHLGELEHEVKETNNNMFSNEKQEQIAKYYDGLANSDNKKTENRQ